jgi:hypothetical protein
MSKWMSALGLLALVSSVSQGATQYLGPNNFVPLDVRQNKVNVHINYPGKLSGVCGVRVVLSQQFLDEKVAHAIAAGLVVRDFGETLKAVPTRGAIRYSLKSIGKYVGMVSVETRSGISLENLFKKYSARGGLEMGQPLKAVLAATRCK